MPRATRNPRPRFYSNQSRYVAPPSSRSTLLLDSISQQPRFAGWLGGKLREAYEGPILRVRRDSDNDELNINATWQNVTDTAGIDDFCGGGTGYLVTNFDQSGNSYDITQATKAKQPIIYSEAALGEIGDGIMHAGGLVLGQKGVLAAYFPYSDGNSLTRSDTLGIVGDVPITFAGDVSFQTNTLADGYIASIGVNLQTAIDKNFDFYVYNALVDPGPEYPYVEYGATRGAYVVDPIPDYSFVWRVDRAAGAAIAAARIFLNGEFHPNDASPGNGATPNPTSIPASSAGFSWGCGVGAAYAYYPLFGLASHIFVWQAVLGTDNAAVLTAWQAEHHA